MSYIVTISRIVKTILLKGSIGTHPVYSWKAQQSMNVCVSSNHNVQINCNDALVRPVISSTAAVS